MRSTVITVASALAIIGIGLAVCAAAPLQTGLKPASEFTSFADEKQRSSISSSTAK